MLLSRRNHFTLNQQRFYNTYIFELLVYSLSFCFLRFQNPLLLVLQVLLNGNLRRKYLPHFCDFKISLSNAFLSIRGQLNSFLSLRISVIIIFLDIIFDLITTFQKNCPQSSAFGRSQCPGQVLLYTKIATRSTQG